MKGRLFVLVVLVLAFAAAVMAADNPVTGTWQAFLPVLPVGGGQVIISPASGGISIQMDEGKPETALYGKDSSITGGIWNIVRIDDHNLKSTASRQDGKMVVNETATVSVDGNHYTRTQVEVSSGQKSILEYERVGPMQKGDAFWGTWKRVRLDSQETAPPLRLELIGDGTKVTGTILRWEPKVEIYDGKIEGNTIRFKAKSPDGFRTITLTGTIAGDEISFTRDVQVAEGGNPGGYNIFGVLGPRTFIAKRVR
jgi:hypothetical protein